MPKILVIEDEESIQLLCQLILEKEGYEIFTAVNGSEGLEKAKIIKPDLILLDIMMPVMNGWQFLQKFRIYTKSSLTPIIFFTSLSSIDIRAKVFQMSADDYMMKPFPYSELIFRVKKALNYSTRIKQEYNSKTTTQSFTGSLDEISLASLLTMFETEQKTGILHINATNENQEEVSAKIFIKNGALLKAELDDDNKNCDVIYFLMQLMNGKFMFKSQSISIEDEMNTPLMSILLEGTRMMDEEQHGDKE